MGESQNWRQRFDIGNKPIWFSTQDKIFATRKRKSNKSRAAYRGGDVFTNIEMPCRLRRYTTLRLQSGHTHIYRNAPKGMVVLVYKAAGETSLTARHAASSHPFPSTPACSASTTRSPGPGLATCSSHSHTARNHNFPCAEDATPSTEYGQHTEI